MNWTMLAFFLVVLSIWESMFSYHFNMSLIYWMTPKQSTQIYNFTNGLFLLKGTQLWFTCWIYLKVWLTFVVWCNMIVWYIVLLAIKILKNLRVCSKSTSKFFIGYSTYNKCLGWEPKNKGPRTRFCMLGFQLGHLFFLPRSMWWSISAHYEFAFSFFIIKFF
jgi:hypothetical protein